MQDSYGESQNTDPAPRGVAGTAALAIRWGGAILSVGLVLAVVYWVYSLGVRDATDVPVIRAMSGEPRITPEDPGGSQADHQGLEVNEVLASDEPNPIATDTELAPATQTVTEADLSSAEMAETAPVETAPAETQETTTEPLRVDASQLLVEITPVEEDTAEESDTVAEPSVAPDGMVAPLRRPQSEVFQPRPDVPDTELDSIIDSLIEEAIPEEGSTSLETEEVEGPPPPFGNVRLDPGAALIQLGAFDTLERAADAWRLYQQDHGDLIGEYDRYIEEIEAGGRLLYLLRASGFADLNETQAMCAALNARDVECISATLQ